MKNSDSYYLIFDNKVLETDSLMQMKLDVPRDDWQRIVKETVAFYVQLKQVSKSKNIPLDKQDKKVLKKLERTIALIKKMDPVYVQEIDINGQMVKVNEEMKAVDAICEEQIKIVMDNKNRRGGDGDIHVSGL